MKGLIIFDIIIVVAILAMTGITAMIGVTVLDDFADATQDMPNFNQTYIQDTRTSVVVTDVGSLLIFVCLIAGAIISSSQLKQHPIFAIFSIILLFISAYIVASISNFYQDFATDPAVVVAATDFPFLTSLMQNIVAIMFVMGALIIIAMYARGGEGSGQI